MKLFLMTVSVFSFFFLTGLDFPVSVDAVRTVANAYEPPPSPPSPDPPPPPPPDPFQTV